MGGELHRNNIRNDLSGFFASGTTQGTVTGGSFAYTEPELRKIIQNWHDLADSYHGSIYNAETMTRIEGPGREFASSWHADAANRSGRSYIAYLAHHRDYCRQQAKLFQDALDDYLGIEHTNATDISKTGPDGPQAGI